MTMRTTRDLVPAGTEPAGTGLLGENRDWKGWGAGMPPDWESVVEIGSDAAGTEPPVGTVTFLFTDVEGSTRIVDALGERYGDLLEHHRRLVFSAVEGHAGHPMGHEGDACFAA